MALSARFPARLHVLLARDARTAVVFRRGPSRAVCTVGWDRSADRFSVGQWLRGRIYERRSDLSPDGMYLIYFAMNGRGRSPTGGSYTAVSRAPWLRALVLLGKGDCWHGGGLFLDRRRYWLNDGYGHKELSRSSEVERDPSYVPPARFGGECPGVYYLRLLREGWRLITHIGSACSQCTVFEKQLPRGWTLRKLAHEQIGSPPGRGCYWDEHELEHTETRRVISCPGWEWADLDGSSLVYAERGCLYRTRPPGASGLSEPRLLYDFNDMAFTPIRAPYR